MAAINTTDAAAAIPEVWKTKALLALFSEMVVKNRVNSVTSEVANYGDILHVKVNPTPTVNDVNTSTGAFSAETVTITDVTLTVNRWKSVGHDVLDNAQAQADIDLVDNFTQAFVPALGESIESDILANYTSVTNQVGVVEGSAFDENGIILPSSLLLDDAKVPMKERSWILPPVAVHQLRKNDKFTRADATGLPKGVQTTGFQTDIYGVPVYVTQLSPTNGSGARIGFLLQRDGLMVGIQKNIKVEKFARTQFSTPFGASVMFGSAILRNNHNVVCRLKSTLA